MSTIRQILGILSRKERRHAFLLLGMMFIGMLVETLGIGLAIPAITLFMEEDMGKAYPSLAPMLDRLGNPDRQQVMLWGISFLVLVYLLKSIYLALLVWQQNEFNNRIQVSLSKRLFTLYLRQPYTFHLQRNSAQLIRNVTVEIGYFLSMGLTAIMSLITECLVLIGIVCLLFVVEPIGSLGIILVIGLACLAFHKSTKSMVQRWGRERQLNDGLRIQTVQQGLGGAKDVKLLGREKDFLDQYDKYNAKTARACVNLSILQAMPRLWLELMMVIGLSTIVLTMTNQGKDAMEILPVIGLFAAAAFRLMPSIGKILISVQSIRFGESAVKMLRDELKLEVREEPNSFKQWRFSERIEFLNVSFTYASSGRPAIHGISFVISRGETVGMIGPSGSGKSTLIDVILGLLQPSAGTVLIDNRDMLDDLRGWQGQIGYVPQAIFLTDDTLRNNVAFGIPKDQIDENAVIRALRSARLSDFVESLPDGLDTIVGERGIRLSGGQRQRIGIARALYHDPAVIVLDEATSALDGSTESEVMDAIHSLRGTKTVIIVAHRLSTVESCDRIFRLDEGRLVESGAPAHILCKLAAGTSMAQPEFGLTS